MNRSIVFLQIARQEFDGAANWYEERRSGLGSVFADAVQVELERIAKQPELFSVVYQDVREALVVRFPYCIYFQSEPERILIVAVFHSARDPAAWRDRVD